MLSNSVATIPKILRKTADKIDLATFSKAISSSVVERTVDRRRGVT